MSHLSKSKNVQLACIAGIVVVGVIAVVAMNRNGSGDGPNSLID